MNTVLCVTLPERGHITPAMHVAKELATRGIEMRFAFRHPNSAVFAALGLADALVPPGSRERAVGENSFDRLRTEEIITETGSYIYFRHLEKWVAHARQCIHAVKPLAVLCNPMVYEGALAATLEGVPFASMSTNFTLVMADDTDSPLRRASDALAEQRNAALAPFVSGTACRRGELLLGPPPMVQTTSALAPHAPSDVKLVGPMLDGAPRRQPSSSCETPEVLVAFGTVHRPPDSFLEVLRDAMAQLRDVRFTVSFRSLPGPFSDGVPPNVQLLPFVAQRAALSKASAILHHGGANSANEALWEGVPQLIYPLFSDGFDSATLLEAAQVGRRVPDDVNPASLAALIEGTIANAARRDRSAEVSQSYQSAGRMRDVADELLGAL